MKGINGLMDQVIADAMKQETHMLVLDRPQEEWNEEDLAYVYRHTCGPYEALCAFGGYEVLYDGQYSFAIKQGGVELTTVPGSRLKQAIATLVAERRQRENMERILSRQTISEALEEEEPIDTTETDFADHFQGFSHNATISRDD